MAGTMISRLEGFEEGLLRQGAQKEGPIITVSGLTGSGKSSFVRMLAGRLPGFKVIHSGSIFRKNAEKMGMSLEEYCEKRSEKDDIKTDMETLRQALEGKAIADGHIAGWVLGDWADIRAFVQCPLEERARRVAKREGMGYDDALERVSARDGANAGHYKRLYGIDIGNMKVYNAIIGNSGALAQLEEQAKAVAESVKALQGGEDTGI